MAKCITTIAVILAITKSSENYTKIIVEYIVAISVVIGIFVVIVDNLTRSKTWKDVSIVGLRTFLSFFLSNTSRA